MNGESNQLESLENLIYNLNFYSLNYTLEANNKKFKIYSDIDITQIIPSSFKLKPFTQNKNKFGWEL